MRQALMKCGWSGCVLAAVCVVGLAAAWAAGAPAPLTVDDVLREMNAKASLVKDLRATVRKTSYDSVFEEEHLVRLELYYKKPDWERLDSYKKVRDRDVWTKQMIVGPDFILEVWPDNRHGERERVDPKEMKRRREDRNDPLTFFTRKPDDLKKDFNVELRGPRKAGNVRLVIAPRSKDVPFGYKSLELVVDTKTWMPTSIKAASKDDEDWSLYEFKSVKVNSGLKASDFKPPPGVTVEERAPEPPGARKDPGERRTGDTEKK